MYGFDSLLSPHVREEANGERVVSKTAVLGSIPSSGATLTRAADGQQLVLHTNVSVFDSLARDLLACNSLVRN